MEKTQLTSEDGFQFSAWIATPKEEARGAIIVIQEIFGVNSHIRGVAEGYANDGYLAIAPALFDRTTPGLETGYAGDDMKRARDAMQKQLALGWDPVLKDLRAAVKAVKGAGKVGVVGYCWGGTASWMAASRVEGLAGAVCYYGSGIVNNVDEKPKVPVMFHWGESDKSIPSEARDKIAKAHPTTEAHSYKAGHGFNCDQRESFDKAAAQLARERTLAFFKKHIGC